MDSQRQTAVANSDKGKVITRHEQKQQENARTNTQQQQQQHKKSFCITVCCVRRTWSVGRPILMYELCGRWIRHVRLSCCCCYSLFFCRFGHVIFFLPLRIFFLLASFGLLPFFLFGIFALVLLFFDYWLIHTKLDEERARERDGDVTGPYVARA